MAKHSNESSKSGSNKHGKKGKKNKRTLTEEEILEQLDEMAEDFGIDHTDDFLVYVDHASEKIRASAIRCLWEANLDEVWPVLKQTAETDSSEEVRSTAISVMGRYIFEQLLQSDPDADESDLYTDANLILEVRAWLDGVLARPTSTLMERRRTLEALSFFPQDSERALMTEWSQSEDAELRMTAIFAMGRSAEPMFVEPILKAFEDSDDRVRRESLRAIGEAGMVEGLPLLEAVLNGSNREYKLEAISALGELGGDRAEELVQDLVVDADPEISELANLAVVNIEEARMVEDWQAIRERELAEADEDEDEVQVEVDIDMDGPARR